MTYHSLWCEHRYFLHCLGWDDPTPVVVHPLQSLQGFPGDLVRSLSEDTTLTDILQTLDEHYGMVMIFDMPLVRSSIPSSKDLGTMWLSLECACCSRYRCFSWNTHKGFNRSTWKELKQNHFYEGLSPKYQHMLAHKVDGEHPATYY